MLFAVTVLLAVLNTAIAECPNACSAHGKCGAYDMCSCYRNWMTNDCSERVCQFGLAHVDTPKGDLDSSSGQLTAPSTLVVSGSEVYPYGTSEQFPDMVDSAQTVLTDTAHYYMECSNKGTCDRQSGECQCFDTYSGSACQRAACPDTGNGVCSGHGTCENIKTIANLDHMNIYKLWDEQATMGCVCDGGYSGANCEEKICKYGADPLYQDSYQTIRYSNWTYSVYTLATVTLAGNYSLVLEDTIGESWQTIPIAYDADCATVASALEGIPNSVVPAGSVTCYKWPFDTSFGKNDPIDTTSTTMQFKFTIAFPYNAGNMKLLTIDTHLDGSRTTLYTDEATSTLAWHIYNNGFYGENDDMVPDYCSGVKVTLANSVAAAADSFDYLDSITAAELILLKKCLGDSNGDATDNLEGDVHNWDYGTAANPHLIKLIDATQDEKQYADNDATHRIANKVQTSYLCNQTTTKNTDGLCDRSDPPGFYAAMYWDNTASKFKIFGRPSADYGTATMFHVYTTEGYLNRVSATTQAFNTWNHQTDAAQTSKLLSNNLYTKALTGQTRDSLDCETTSGTGIECLEKEDYMMVFNSGIKWSTAANAPAMTTAQLNSNPVYAQIYQVKKISIEPVPESEWATYEPAATFDWVAAVGVPSFVREQIVTDKSFNTNYHIDTVTAASDTSASVYKFYPPANKYNYAAPCSNRGICDSGNGLCSCFPGYTGDNCQRMDALAN